MGISNLRHTLFAKKKERKKRYSNHRRHIVDVFSCMIEYLHTWYHNYTHDRISAHMVPYFTHDRISSHMVPLMIAHFDTCDTCQHVISSICPNRSVIPHPYLNFLTVDIPTPKPYIFMIGVTRRIKCIVVHNPGVNPHPLPAQNFLTVDIPTPKPYIFRRTRFSYMSI